ncbi:hypothetical protein GCM10010160_16280 [Acrocarpospora corrugata]
MWQDTKLAAPEARPVSQRGQCHSGGVTAVGSQRWGHSGGSLRWGYDYLDALEFLDVGVAGGGHGALEGAHQVH